MPPLLLTLIVLGATLGLLLGAAYLRARAAHRLGVGDVAPDCPVVDQLGQPTTLAALRGGRVLVLFFYPRDFTPICTTQACAFRDTFEDFRAAGAVVVGVSRDAPGRHQAFAAQHGLPFTLLSDAGGRLHAAFGVPPWALVLPGRVTYVMDQGGVIRLVVNTQFHAERHIAAARAMVRQLTAVGDRRA